MIILPFAKMRGEVSPLDLVAMDAELQKATLEPQAARARYDALVEMR
jgi:hypothetical protein